MFDIDRFRSVNDRLGWKGGDALLRAVVGRVRQATREADLIARLDGDTFAVLQYNGQAVDKLAARLVDLFGRPYLIRGEVRRSAPAWGGARSGGRHLGAVLLRHAEFARHEAKEAGGQTWRHYGHSMADRARLRQELEADLRPRSALEPIQPVLSAADQFAHTGGDRVRGAGTLDPSQTRVVPPSVFIPVAEDIGLIEQSAIGRCTRPVRTPRSGRSHWSSRSTFRAATGRQATFHVAGGGGAAGVGPAHPAAGTGTDRNRADRRPEEARVLLRDLHELGVRLALDNFGAGCTSLRHLLTFPFDTIKIDQSFIGR